MLSDRKAFYTLHLRWFVAMVVATVVAISWYAVASYGRDRWPGGSSLVGLTYGVLAAAIIVFECLLVVRKTSLFRTSRWLGSAQFWMKAHIWLGLLAVPLVIMHSGFDWGGWLSSLVAGVFALVTASGIYGLYMQNIIPRRLLELVPDETIHSQIDDVAQQLAADARRLVGLRVENAAFNDRAEKHLRRGATRTVVSGAPRQVGTIVERSPRPNRELPQEIVAPAVLQNALVQDIEPFLLTGRSPLRRLDTSQRCSWYFEELRRRIDTAEIQVVVSSLEQFCERRRQMNLQQSLHFWLHGWLSIHLPLAMALVILLVGHIWFALRYS
ncbi:hypothetical protein [Anatilimnocola aggregata]|uniref:hypothetical protein n=1 Tax=Anatilimnocola aggregata TaxID=2528021 RepID=UPI0011A5A379|nr:hypothetical protein [Anatilimnocola aggregata]